MRGHRFHDTGASGPGVLDVTDHPDVNDLVLDKHITVRTHGFKNPLIATVVEPVEEVIAAPVVAAEPAKGKKKK